MTIVVMLGVSMLFAMAVAHLQQPDGTTTIDG